MQELSKVDYVVSETIPIFLPIKQCELKFLWITELHRLNKFMQVCYNHYLKYMQVFHNQIEINLIDLITHYHLILSYWRKFWRIILTTFRY